MNNQIVFDIEDFVCPMSLQYLLNPVTLSNGKIYEKQLLEKLFDGKSTAICPMTRNLIHSNEIIIDAKLKRLLDSYFENHPEKLSGRYVEEIKFVSHKKLRMIIFIIGSIFITIGSYIFQYIFLSSWLDRKTGIPNDMLANVEKIWFPIFCTIIIPISVTLCAYIFAFVIFFFKKDHIDNTNLTIDEKIHNDVYFDVFKNVTYLLGLVGNTLVFLALLMSIITNFPEALYVGLSNFIFLIVMPLIYQKKLMNHLLKKYQNAEEMENIHQYQTII